MPRRIESHFLAGPAGRLEALLEEPEDREPRMAALVCHPHPLYGGTMHNKVVYRMARGLRRSGLVVLRFNFRGVGNSEGEHGQLTGEIRRCFLRSQECPQARMHARYKREHGSDGAHRLLTTRGWNTLARTRPQGSMMTVS